MPRNRGNKPNSKLEKLSFSGDYSMKNIPIPNRNEYMKKLIAQMEKIIKNMRWKALFYLKENDQKYNSTVENFEFYEREETYGFKTDKKPPPTKEMEFFEKDFYEIARNITFHSVDKNYGKFQNKMKKDQCAINRSKKVIIPSDKSPNFYTCEVETYRDLRDQNVQKEYIKSNSNEVQKVDKESCRFAKELKLEKRMQNTQQHSVFSHLKTKNQTSLFGHNVGSSMRQKTT